MRDGMVTLGSPIIPPAHPALKYAQRCGPSRWRLSNDRHLQVCFGRRFSQATPEFPPAQTLMAERLTPKKCWAGGIIEVFPANKISRSYEKRSLVRPTANGPIHSCGATD
jgi:hypothetical protein